jgi:hypothetical protein
LKHGTTEVVFQELSSKALEPSERVGKALEVRDEEGFFTRDGVEGLVQDSRYLDPDETIRESMLVFRTERQQTWLISTNKHVFFILDDERTRASQRLIQRRQQLEESLPVTTREHTGLSGVFQLGVSGFWYYSIALLGPPGTARRRLERFLNTARA